MTPLALVDAALSDIRRQELVSQRAVIDALLDIRNSLTSVVVLEEMLMAETSNVAASSNEVSAGLAAWWQRLTGGKGGFA